MRVRAFIRHSEGISGGYKECVERLLQRDERYQDETSQVQVVVAVSCWAMKADR